MEADERDSLRNRLDSYEFNQQRCQILNSQCSSPDQERNFTFINEGREFVDKDRHFEEKNTAEKRNMVLEIRLKENEENMRRSEERLMREICFYKQKFEEIRGKHEEIVDKYEQRIDQLNRENTHLHSENVGLRTEKDSISKTKVRSRANSMHKFESNKRFSLENDDMSEKNRREEIGQTRKELEKTKLILDNVYSDNEKLIALVKELEGYKRDFEGLQGTNEYLQREVEAELQEIERLKTNIGDLRAENEEIRDESKRLEMDNQRIVEENEGLLAENDKILKENESFLAENNRILKENEVLLAENDRILKENEQLNNENQSLISSYEELIQDNETNKRKEQQVHSNLLSQMQELQASSQLQAKNKLKTLENTIQELRKENKSLKNSCFKPTDKENHPQKREINVFNNENCQFAGTQTASNQVINSLMNTLGVKGPDAVLDKVQEMLNFQKNTHKLLNSIADLMKGIVPGMVRPSLKEMWAFLKFTVKNYQEIKGRYEEELGIYARIKQILNAELREEVLYNLNALIQEKKLFLQIIDKVRGIMGMGEHLSLVEVNQELLKWAKK